MAKKGDATPPTPVDPTAVSNAQTASNQQTAQFQSTLNNGNSYTPYGSVTQTQDPTTNQWTSTTSLSPSEQGLFNTSQANQQGALDVAGQQIGRVGQALGQGLTPGNIQMSFDPGQAVQGQVNAGDTNEAVQRAIAAQYASAQNILGPQQQQQQRAQSAALAAQGLNPNSAAYQNSQTLFQNGQNEAQNQAINSAVAAGNTEQNTLYNQALSSGQFANNAAAQMYGQNQGLASFNNQAAGELFNQQAAAQSQPINEFAALMGQGQVQSPTGTGFNPTSVSPTDVTGAYALSAQQQQQQYQSQLAQQQAGLSGLYGLGSAALMFA